VEVGVEPSRPDVLCRAELELAHDVLLEVDVDLCSAASCALCVTD